ncbi:hypothetical protein DINM_020920 [Dirofilaria immitis]|nr:hypothetical protein [Dirofilaria immitis]
MSSLTSSPYVSESQKCLNERLNTWKSFKNDDSVAISNKNSDSLAMVAIENVSGFISAKCLFPLINMNIRDSKSFVESYINDYRDGSIIILRCYRIKDQCVCTTQRVYAHRRRPHLLIQELQTTNPSNSDIEIELSVKTPEYWTQKRALTLYEFLCITTKEPPLKTRGLDNNSLSDPVYTRYFESDGAHTLAAVACTKIPKTVTEFADYSPLDGTILYREHSTAWHKLNMVTFGISKSLAPNALNADEINATRYILLSNIRDPLLEIGVSKEQKEAAASSMKIIDMCYTGHSTLLTPSRLWRKSDNINDIIETMDIWLLTLEKRGCSGLLKAGASGLAEAFILSLLASKFSREHLEVDIDPAHLLREITVQSLAYSLDTRISISVRLSNGNRPYFMISSDSQVFACDAACLNHPIAIGHSSVQIPVKVTKPATPILYISRNKNHLEQLRGTIHVVEVMDAPAHEHGLIALHKHGHRLGGLPVIFWLMLGTLMLLYSEWKKVTQCPIIITYDSVIFAVTEALYCETLRRSDINCLIKSEDWKVVKTEI